jgi:hypothetical protein
MADIASVEKAIKNLSGGEKFFGRGEIKALPSILWEDELPEKIIQGTYNNGGGILVATNKRLVFVDKGLMSLKVEDFPYDRITSIQYTTGMLMGGIDIYASGNKAEIKNVTKDQVKPFAEYIRARITGASAHASASVSPQTSAEGDNPVRKLKQIKEMLDAGLISQAEYEAKKTELLSRM